MIVAGGVRLPEHVPERYRALAPYSHTGDSCIIDPRGEILAGPVRGETILTAEGSLEAVFAAKAVFDVAGHYSRPDVLQLHVNRRPLGRTIESSEHLPGFFPELPPARTQLHSSPDVKTDRVAGPAKDINRTPETAHAAE